MEDGFDFEKRILATAYTGNEENLDVEHFRIREIKDLGFPQVVEKKLKGFVNYARASSSANLLLIGCPEKYVSKILDTLSFEVDVRSRLVKDAYLKSGDVSAILTNLLDGDIVCFANIEALNPEIMLILKQAMLDFQLNITVGKGPSARNIQIDLPKFSLVLVADNMAQVPKELIESFDEVIDFNKYDYDLRLMFINDFALKHDLTFSKDVKERLAKQFTQYDQLTIQLIEIRNQARESNVHEITESLFIRTLDSIPELDRVDEMDGRNFELFTSDLLYRNGFENINVTQASHDFGVDVIAEKDDIKYAIQCKRYNGPIGVSAVQEVIASKSLHDCHVACVLTNSSFTPAAIELAKKNLVILWDRRKLQKFIDNAQK